MNLFLKSMKMGKLEPQRARLSPNKAGIKWISHSVTKFVRSSKPSKSKSAVRNTLMQSHILLLPSRWRYDGKYEKHLWVPKHTCTQAHLHVFLMLAQRNLSMDFTLLGGILTSCKRKCSYILYFYLYGWKAESDDEAFSYREGVDNKTRGSLIPFFPGKYWGIKLQKMPGLGVTSGEQQLKGPWAMPVKSRDIYRKCEINVCVPGAS